ncbi:MAG TPA: hypothetical protein VFT28_01125 [Gemmatimonadales bacterium]|nr:hypothetical protein [Gemmatimonadales bacterium]
MLFEALLAPPLWNFAFRFASRPATTLEACATATVSSPWSGAARWSTFSPRCALPTARRASGGTDPGYGKGRINVMGSVGL